MNLLKDPRTNWRYILIVVILAIVVGGGTLGYRYWWLPGEELKTPEEKAIEEVIKVETTRWKEYTLEKISQDFKSPDFFDRRLVGIQDTGQRDVIVFSMKETLGESKENITWYPREVSFPSYSSKIFFVKQLSETAHSIGFIMFDVKTLTFQELSVVGQIYENYYNYVSIVSPDGLKIASLGGEGLYLLDLLQDKVKLLVEVRPGEVFYPAKEVPDFAWLDNYTIQYPVYSAERIYDPPIEIRQISIKDQKEVIEDETVNWKTYRNEEYGFEVKYPTDYVVNTKDPARVYFEPSEFMFIEGPFPTIEIINKSLEEQKEFLKQQYEIPESPFAKIIEKEDIIIDNWRGKDMIFMAETGVEVRYILIFYEGRIYQLEADNVSEIQTVFNQMLSTFRFLE